jgi:hypothetical protein
VTVNKKTLTFRGEKVYNKPELRKEKTMKKVALCILFVCLFASTGLAYTYEVYTYGPSKNLKNEESILIDQQGGMHGLTLEYRSSADIFGTSDLVDGFGGIWQINLGNNSHLNMFSGQVHEIDISHSATAILKGGLIESIYSYQIVPDPHITLYYSGTLPMVQKINGFDYLVGNWGNGDPFSIYLHNTGYNAYGNFEFILVPEPTSLAFLALGGWLVTQQKRSHAPHSNCA